MRRLLLPLVSFPLVFFLSGCALLSTRVPVVEWPEDVTFLQGEGDIDARWQGEKSSATFAVKMEYPDTLIFEVYGSPFGQTVIHIEKNGGKLLVITGKEKTTDEAPFKEKYGFGVGQLMDALAMKGKKEETPEGLLVRQDDYSIVYGEDRKGRKTMCLEKTEGRICLDFTQIAFADR